MKPQRGRARDVKVPARGSRGQGALAWCPGVVPWDQPGSTSPDLGRPQLSSAFRPPDHTTRYIMHMLGCLLVALHAEPHKERSSRHAPKMTWQLLHERCTSIGDLCKAHKHNMWPLNRRQGAVRTGCASLWFHATASETRRNAHQTSSLASQLCFIYLS